MPIKLTPLIKALIEDKPELKALYEERRENE